MIAGCPRCSTRFRIGAERLREEGVRLRCTQCQAVFRVYPPRAAAPRRRDDPAVDAELTPPPRAPERDRMVLVADPDPARGKASASELGRLGLYPLLVHDGVDALLALQRSLPACVLIDAALPRLSGAELCEVVKRNESLRGTYVVLCGSPEQLSGVGVLRVAGLGPDAMLEYGDLPEGLSEALRVSRHEDAPIEPPVALEPPVSLAPPVALEPPVVPEPTRLPVPTPTRVDSNPEIARAERLARIVVSEIVLYNAERFERAAREDDVLEALAGELAEARHLFRQRFPAQLCEGRDLVAEELLRVARSRAAH
jgi:predicted Zn finger-like uncharacterized protein